ncbi:MAG: hypothetical protein AMJ78_06090 [Omnitrophica WOR_2 bacterium SM23_29]|nr:MAG: hypothetical protein AMJ78_06090 [Omnitrophica WOR_2 bacterium SM23_29]
MAVGQVFVDTLATFLDRIAQFLPALLGAILVLILGLVIAKLVQKVITQILKIARLDILSEKAGIASILAKGDIKYTLSELIGVITYWLLILTVVIAALDTLNLKVAAELLDKVVLYVPNVILAVFILVLGLFFAALIGSIVRTTASNAGLAYAKNLGQIAQVVIVVFSILITLSQLGVRTVILDQAILIFLASLGLGLALAFGMGSKDTAGKIMSDLVDKWKKR